MCSSYNITIFCFEDKTELVLFNLFLSYLINVRSLYIIGLFHLIHIIPFKNHINYNISNNYNILLYGHHYKRVDFVYCQGTNFTCDFKN